MSYRVHFNISRVFDGRCYDGFGRILHLVSSFVRTVAASIASTSSKTRFRATGLKNSMSRKGNCWENAPTKSVWGRLKVDTLFCQKFATRRETMDEVIDWLSFYKHSRLHSTLGYVSPMKFAEQWSAAEQLKAA